MRCNNCGGKIHIRDEFCSHCGHRIEHEQNQKDAEYEKYNEDSKGYTPDIDADGDNDIGTSEPVKASKWMWAGIASIIAIAAVFTFTMLGNSFSRHSSNDDYLAFETSDAESDYEASSENTEKNTQETEFIFPETVPVTVVTTSPPPQTTTSAEIIHEAENDDEYDEDTDEDKSNYSFFNFGWLKGKDSQDKDSQDRDSNDNYSYDDSYYKSFDDNEDLNRYKDRDVETYEDSDYFGDSKKYDDDDILYDDSSDGYDYSDDTDSSYSGQLWGYIEDAGGSIMDAAKDFGSRVTDSVDDSIERYRQKIDEYRNNLICTYCEGTGYVDGHICDVCHGTGLYQPDSYDDDKRYRYR